MFLFVYQIGVSLETSIAPLCALAFLLMLLLVYWSVPPLEEEEKLKLEQANLAL